MKNIPTNEQEATISFSRTEDTANIWTSDSVVMNKLDKFVEDENSPWKCTGVGKNEEGGVVCKEYTVTKNMISFRSKKITGRKLTEEQKARQAKILRTYRENKKSNSLEDN